MLNPLFLNIFLKNVQCPGAPHMTYCSTIWNDGSNSILNKLSKLQRRAARVITGQSCEVRSTQILESLNWILIEYTLKYRETTMTFKALLPMNNQLGSQIITRKPEI